MIALDCRRCGHGVQLSPWRLIPRRSPSTPWRWLRWRCERCGANDVLVRVGTALQLSTQQPERLYDYEDLLAILSDAIYVGLHYDSDRVIIDRDRARRLAVIVLRRLMAAGVSVSAPTA